MAFFLGFTRELIEILPQYFFQKIRIASHLTPKYLPILKEKQIYFLPKFKKIPINYLPLIFSKK